MLNREVLIKLLNTRSSTTGQGLCQAAVWFAEGGIWGRRESVGGKQSTDHQSCSPGWINPVALGWETHPANGYVSIGQLCGLTSTKTWLSLDLTHPLSCPRG